MKKKRDKSEVLYFQDTETQEKQGLDKRLLGSPVLVPDLLQLHKHIQSTRWHCTAGLLGSQAWAEHSIHSWPFHRVNYGWRSVSLIEDKMDTIALSII
jgi:hypothetical protein